MLTKLVISVPAQTRGFLTAEELRAAAGTSPLSDGQLAKLGETVADIISEDCNVKGDGLNPVTLRRETLIETQRTEDALPVLSLARRFIGSVAVVENGQALTDADIEVDAGAGLLYRLRGDFRCHWPAGKIVVTYQAGFEVVPGPLADIAAEMVGRRTGATRDPLMKSERVRIDDVEEIERDFWVDARNNVDITPDMAAKLVPYRTETA